MNLSSLMYHPLIESLGFGSILSSKLFYKLLPSIGVATLFFPDKSNINNKLTTNPSSDSVEIDYTLSNNQEILMKSVVKKVKKFLLTLGCIPRGGINYSYGSGIHYAGTIPMGVECDEYGKSIKFNNLYIADSSAFPSLPSKPITINAIAFSSFVATNSFGL